MHGAALCNVRQHVQCVVAGGNRRSGARRDGDSCAKQRQARLGTGSSTLENGTHNWMNRETQVRDAHRTS